MTPTPKPSNGVVTTRRKIKKQKDLWDTFRAIQKKHLEAWAGPKVMAFALSNIEWEGYVTGLHEFGIISKKDFDEVMAWRPQ